MDETNQMQLARMIFHRVLSIMKFTLDLEEQKYPERGRHDDRYKFFKKQIMSCTYDNLRQLFKDLEEWNLIESIPNEDLKNGYKATESGGSGFINSKSFQDWLNAK